MGRATKLNGELKVGIIKLRFSFSEIPEKLNRYIYQNKSLIP